MPCSIHYTSVSFTPPPPPSPSSQVQIEDVETEEKRLALFLELLEAARRWDDFQLLVLLLQAWPPMTTGDTSQSERNPWVALTSALLTRCQGSEVTLDLGRQVVAMVRSLYNTKHKLPVPCLRRIAGLMLQSAAGLQQPALKLMSESGDEELLRLTLDQIGSMTASSASALPEQCAAAVPRRDQRERLRGEGGRARETGGK
ncbi:Neuroblastoma-amplified sequence, partial [Takifugu flavidus]